MKKMRNKGISPVLASIILLAVTVAVGVGVASYVFGLFGSYTEAAAVKVSGSPTFLTNGTIVITLLNSGAQADTVSSISTVIGGTRETVTPTSGATVSGGGSTSTVRATFTNTPTSGVAYQIRISFTSGNQLSLQVIASS